MVDLVRVASRRLVLAATKAVALGAVVLGTWLGTPDLVHARGASEAVGLQSEAVRLSELPSEAADIHRRILAGGPFRYPGKDGSVFGNRERHLPRQTRGYYREYTVPTAGSRDRGARRIICGGLEPTTPDVCFYTQDHYASFHRIAP